jgi:hypothetical protein
MGRSGDEPGDTDTGAEGDAVLVGSGLSQHPLERGAAHDEHLEVFVARAGVPERRRHRHRERAAGEQVRVDIGEAFAQHHLDAREEAVGLVHLGCAAPLGGEGGLRVGGRWERVALEDRHRGAGAGQTERGREPADPPTDDHHGAVLQGLVHPG